MYCTINDLIEFCSLAMVRKWDEQIYEIENYELDKVHVLCYK